MGQPNVFGHAVTGRLNPVLDQVIVAHDNVGLVALEPSNDLLRPRLTSTATATPSLEDYATFTGLTGSTSQVLTLAPLGGSLLGLSGFQLIDTTAAPEPSTWALMLGGLGMLGFLVRRKRAARI